MTSLDDVRGRSYRATANATAVVDPRLQSEPAKSLAEGHVTSKRQRVTAERDEREPWKSSTEEVFDRRWFLWVTVVDGGGEIRRRSILE